MSNDYEPGQPAPRSGSIRIQYETFVHKGEPLPKIPRHSRWTYTKDRWSWMRQVVSVLLAFGIGVVTPLGLAAVAEALPNHPTVETEVVERPEVNRCRVIDVVLFLHKKPENVAYTFQAPSTVTDYQLQVGRDTTYENKIESKSTFKTDVWANGVCKFHTKRDAPDPYVRAIQRGPERLEIKGMDADVSLISLQVLVSKNPTEPTVKECADGEFQYTINVLSGQVVRRAIDFQPLPSCGSM